jgi:hypothetical protein
LSYVAPTGEEDDYLARAMRAIVPYLPQEQDHGASKDLRTA